MQILALWEWGPKRTEAYRRLYAYIQINIIPYLDPYPRWRHTASGADLP